MGLIKAAASAINSTFADQWEDYIKCDELDSNNLVVKKTSKTGRISSKSSIQVGPNQAVIIVDSGKILDVTAEQGIYTFDSSTSPSIFAGQFGDSAKEIWKRFIYGGEAANEQVVYYVNLQNEIQGNKFGSQSPLPYDDPVYRGIYIRYFGSYTFKIADPVVFFNSISNDIEDVYTKDKLMEQIDNEFVMSIDDAIGRCAQDGIKYNQLSLKAKEIAKYMNDALDDEWVQKRGLVVTSVGLNKITPDDDSRERIQKFDNAAMFSQQEYAVGRMVEANANAMEGAANNANGAVNGFMGLGMMNMSANNMMGGQSPLSFVQNQSSQAPNNFQNASTVNTVVDNSGNISNNESAQSVVTSANNNKTCSNCGTPVAGKFCSNCGTAVMEDKPKTCSNCGATPIEGAKFCVECGNPLN